MASFFGFARGPFPDARFARGDPYGRSQKGRQRSSGELVDLINGEVVPRMVALAPEPAGAADMVVRAPVITADDVDDFALAALSVEADGLLDRVDAFIAAGVPIPMLLLDLLPGAARRMGVYWEEDRCDFLEVTLGTWRLQELVHALSARLPITPQPGAAGRRILIAPLPGESHALGATLLAYIFEGDGWQTDRAGEVSLGELTTRMARDWYDVVGLTVSSDCHMGALPSAIRALRRASVNPRLQVIVGGPVIDRAPEAAIAAGADGTAADARQAVAMAKALVDAADTVPDVYG